MSLSGASVVADIPVICGPTGAGKSDLALRLAERHGRAILVADSRQVYRGFDVGTAKPTDDERRRVAHLGIDVADPTERYSAAQWAALADSALADGGANPPIVVGGSGLYLRALFEGLFAEPPLDTERRAAIQEWLETQPTDELRRWVRALDPSRASLGRTQLLRAIEVALLTGTPISELHATRATGSRWRPRYLVVDPGASLHDRIARRLQAMIDAGWLDEVRQLHGVPDDAPAWNASGYRAMKDVAEGRVSLGEAKERILIETRQYAKRQRTWFRHQLPADLTTRVNPEQADIDAMADRWLTEPGFVSRNGRDHE